MRSEKKFLHLFDAAIIGQATIELFEKLDFNQRYVVIASPSDSEKWTKFASKIENIIIINNKITDVGSALLEEIKAADIIFAQALSFEKARAIKQTKDDGKVFIWGLWGYGLYNFVNYQKNEKSSDEFSTTLKSKTSLIGQFKEYYTFNIIYKKAIQKIDICLFLLESDFNLLGEVIQHKAKWKTACYQTIDNLIGGNKDYKITGNSILLGNSSTPSNRHKVVLDQLKKVDGLDQKVITPLNYGDAEYKAYILDEGTKVIGDNFKPLTEFMPLEEYTSTIQECSHVIMAHKRQQGFGTIMMMLYGGAKLYLSEDSPFYSWLKNLGVVVYSIENELTTELKLELPSEIKEANKAIVSEYLSEISILHKLKEIMDESVQISTTNRIEKAQS
ncbi:MAG: dTDP-N-acetylfucosamine:lipid II N-acetylfucosaminyltransferase [Crocinitomicaceae bacterium]|jgi:dTDP-N-acetylfucosamine:lipid II N-acetylfucosaminyltransferase